MTNMSENKELIISEYQLYLLRNGEMPVTIFAFCEKLGLSENEFYDHFNSFKSLEKEIWSSFFDTVRSAIENDQEYVSFTTHEKVLSFHYTLLELYKQNRSLVTLRFSALNYQHIRPWFLDQFHEAFKSWTDELLNEAFEKDEIVNRPLVSDKYCEALWVQFLYITRVWINDESDQFQVSDAAIEKTGALIFELMKKGPVDLIVDFIKFAYQNKAY